MPKAYVIGALVPRGGTFMAYHIGLILQKEFGYAMVNVQPFATPPTRQFEYEIIPPTASIAEMERAITDDDLLVVNASFSPHMFGLRLKGRKICYVQGFYTFSILDCRFDLYVSVSTLVRDFLRAVYAMETLVIPPFIQLERLPDIVPWHARPTRSVLVYVKHIKDAEANQAAAHYLLREINARMPGLKLEIIKHNNLPHDEFLRRLGTVRYLVNVSLAEGFGLIPLEAMALGTCVTGLDGLAGRDYMRFGENSMTYPGKTIDQVVPTLERLLQDERLAAAMAMEGMQDAQCFNVSAFRAAWTQALREFLEG